jgi:spore germination cell wall hydrolase CwlJ-like protein
MLTSLLQEVRIWLVLWRRRLTLHGSGKELLSHLLVLGLPVLALAGIIRFAYVDAPRANPAPIEAMQRQAAAAERRADELECLAENVYFEARGEPLAGQYAVAEVTLNRTHTAHFPHTICGVVHETRWNPERRHYVADFSWTELGPLSPQGGPAWKQAMAVARATYDDQHESVVPGALYYHSTDSRPAWSRTHKLIATIGRHRFYL